jgi:hypothetical protein
VDATGNGVAGTSYLDQGGFFYTASNPVVATGASSSLSSAGITGTKINLVGGGFQSTTTGSFTANRSVTQPDVTGNAAILPTVTTTETGSGAVVKAISPTITTPAITGASTGTGVQGTDSKLMTSGAVSGTSVTLCTDANGGATTTGCTVNIPLNVFSNKNLASNVSITANTLTTVDSINLTMPSSGGPWRALVTYTYFNNGGVNVQCYVTDATNNWALFEQSTVNNITDCVGSQWSPGTYANSANVTFTVKEFNTGASTVTTVGSLTGSIPSSMQVAIFSSN